MLKFLFKRGAAGKADAASTPPVATPAAAAPRANPGTEKQAAIERARILPDEAAALAFLAECPFADARLVAADKLVSAGALEAAIATVRNSDRRVAKTLQTRLDALRRESARQERANACVQEARALLRAERLTANQVAELDRRWEASGIADAGPGGAGIREEFDAVRAALAQRLAGQAALQRRLIDAVGVLRSFDTELNEAGAREAQAGLAASAAAIDDCLSAPDAASLPVQLKSDAAGLRERVASRIAAARRRIDADRVRAGLLAAWEVADLATLDPQQLRREWRAVAGSDVGTDAGLEARFAGVLARSEAHRKPAPRPEVRKERGARPAIAPEARQEFAASLESLSHALVDGALHAAMDADKALRALEESGLQADRAQAAELARARAELRRLQGWARWGGSVSRDELLRAAESLPAEELPVDELAKRVGSLRARWKSLDAASGAAGREAWERFDAACTRAYAPVAEHARRQAEERQRNREKAEGLLADAREQAARDTSRYTEADWKALAQFRARLQAAWRTLGPIDRKERRQLDREFAAVLAALDAPLAGARAAGIRRREALIADTEAIDPTARGAVDQVKALQDRWQQEARSLPLERKDEQALWQRFRAACDAVFSSRKMAASAADDERRANLREKEALCERLEQAVGAPPSVTAPLVRDVKAAWERIGHVPRSAEQDIAARYHAALQAIDEHRRRAERLAQAARQAALRNKLALCLAAEGALRAADKTPPSTAAALRQEWSALPPSRPEFDGILGRRFETALAALESGTPPADPVPALAAEHLLRLEILLGIDSPPELARERLRLQVDVLQSALRSGQSARGKTLDGDVLRLCGTPVHGEADEARVLRIVDAWGAGQGA